MQAIQHFYNHDKEFNNFININIDDKKRIDELSTILINKLPFYDRLDFYCRVMSLANPAIGRVFFSKPYGIKIELKSFDEAVIFLINCCDPNCDIYKEYLRYDINSNVTFEHYIRVKYGFFSINLLKYEKIFISKFNTRLITDVNKDYSKHIMLIETMVKKFDSVTIQKFKQIKAEADMWSSISKSDNKIQACGCVLVNQSHLLNLNNREEKMIFFISAIDPDLNLLRISEEESHITNIVKRCNEEVGLYSKNIIKLEKIYHDKFIPDKEISIWDEPKKKVLK